MDGVLPVVVFSGHGSGRAGRGWSLGVQVVDAALGSRPVEVVDRFQFVEVVSGVEVVAEVLAVAGLHHPDFADAVGEGFGDLGGVAVAGPVAVGDHDHPASATQPAGVVVGPLPRAHRVARRELPGLAGSLHVLLALAYVQLTPGVERFAHVGELPRQRSEPGVDPLGSGPAPLVEALGVPVLVRGVQPHHRALDTTARPPVDVGVDRLGLPDLGTQVPLGRQREPSREDGLLDRRGDADRAGGPPAARVRPTSRTLLVGALGQPVPQVAYPQPDAVEHVLVVAACPAAHHRFALPRVIPHS